MRKGAQWEGGPYRGPWTGARGREGVGPPGPTATRGRGGDNAYGSVGCLLAKGKGVRCGCQELSVHTGG